MKITSIHDAHHIYTVTGASYDRLGNLQYTVAERADPIRASRCSIVKVDPGETAMDWVKVANANRKELPMTTKPALSPPHMLVLFVIAYGLNSDVKAVCEARDLTLAELIKWGYVEPGAGWTTTEKARVLLKAVTALPEPVATTAWSMP
jgi:hypothetical protein